MIRFPAIAFALATALPAADQTALEARLLAATTKHLDALLRDDGSVARLKGKTADGQTALAFYLTFEATRDERYRRAAVALADRVLDSMRRSKFGVLAIKEKEKPGGESILGGGPPAFGFYTADLGYILHREGGRAGDLLYLARVVDMYPWNEEGWWSADIDVATGESKVPLSKPSIINKSASVAMAAGALGGWVADLDGPLAARLMAKVGRFVRVQLVPSQLPDGFWHYSLSGNDPKNKDILGYFMLTTAVLMQLQHFNPGWREPALDTALARAQGFALRCIAPMTDPNSGPPCEAHTTPSTPRHYSLAREPKRGYELGLILLGSGSIAEGTRIMDAALEHFPSGNAGQDGAHAAEPAALARAWLRQPSRSTR